MPQAGLDPLAVKDELCEHCHKLTPEPPRLDSYILYFTNKTQRIPLSGQ